MISPSLNYHNPIFVEKKYDFSILSSINNGFDPLLFLSYEENVNLFKNRFTDKIYSFSQDWFTSHIPYWENTFNKSGFDFKNPDKTIHCLEIGSFEGRSAVYIANNMLLNKNSTLICCDTFLGSLEHITDNSICNSFSEQNTLELLFSRFCHNIFATGKSDQIYILRGSSLLEIPKLEKLYYEYFDFIYVDGSHEAKDVLIDCLNTFSLLKIGGIMILDDYGWGTKTEDRKYVEPKLGIDTFFSFFEGRYEIIEIGYQVHIKKIKSSK